MPKTGNSNSSSSLDTHKVVPSRSPKLLLPDVQYLHHEQIQNSQPRRRSELDSIIAKHLLRMEQKSANLHGPHSRPHVVTPTHQA